MDRKDKTNYYLDIADTVSNRSTCIRRQYGAIIVRNDEILSTGYNGAPRGRRNCGDIGHCTRESLDVPVGERYELCRSVHAEANAIISAARRDMMGGTLFLAGREYQGRDIIRDAAPCLMCKRLIINAGITRIVSRTGADGYEVTEVRDWIFNDDSLGRGEIGTKR